MAFCLSRCGYWAAARTERRREALAQPRPSIANELITRFLPAHALQAQYDTISETFIPLSRHDFLLESSGRRARFSTLKNAPLAQLAEQVTLNHWVVGSIPTRCKLLLTSNLDFKILLGI